ncbi:MAG: YtxH domain-containing protein [Deltaproteobacteria bacterium]|nr:YtxH domain-containing protein [Deltaproteobacteria bacterium]MBK8235683.1 YtxH domain-containing protein [Deltaproteobacteria bacterium]MBK8713319.1 YtxH domain-containing protein [Deltaproteobacteria bacterium]MBP7289336.1 YtxH domain-containing protein [Nannocystaceae bacterium]
MFDRAKDYGESALAAIGLQPRRSTSDYLLPALGLFGVGVLVGAGLGLMFAPKRGAELRGDISRGVRTVGEKIRRRRESIDASDADASEAGDDVLTAVPTR